VLVYHYIYSNKNAWNSQSIYNTFLLVKQCIQIFSSLGIFKCLPTSILSLWQEHLNFESDLLWVKGISNTKYLSTIGNYLKCL